MRVGRFVDSYMVHSVYDGLQSSSEKSVQFSILVSFVGGFFGVGFRSEAGLNPKP